MLNASLTCSAKGIELSGLDGITSELRAGDLSQVVVMNSDIGTAPEGIVKKIFFQFLSKKSKIKSNNVRRISFNFVFSIFRTS